MIDLPGNRISGLPFGELYFRNELMDFDGSPMLIHYVNDKGNDILSYWVDFDEEKTRWLNFRISKNLLYSYLSKKASFKSILTNLDTEFVFFTDIDNNNNVLGQSMINSDLIPSTYIPGQSSFYTKKLSDEYLIHLKEIHFKNILLDNSYIIKGKPSIKSHGDFLTAKESSFVLQSVYRSQDAYVFIASKNLYRHKFGDEKRVDSLSRSLSNYLTPVVTNAAINSFEVWLAMDTVTLNTVDDVGSRIKSEIVEGYKRDVLDVDFSSEEDARIICEKYDAIERKKIYGPIIEMLENEKIDITISDRQKSIRNDEKPVKASDKFKNLVVPRESSELDAEAEKSRKLYTLVVSLKEGTDISRVTKREILDNLLLFGNDIEVPYQITGKIEENGKIFEIIKPIPATLKITDGDTIEITSEIFNVGVKGKDLGELVSQLKSLLAKIITDHLGKREFNTEMISIMLDYFGIEIT